MLEQNNLDLGKLDLVSDRGERPKKNSIEMAFCCRRGRCPTLKVSEDSVILGGEKEGFTYWSRDNLRDFVNAAKDGRFDGLL